MKGTIVLNEQLEIQEVMTNVFNSRKQKNSSYSLRAFARDLDMNSGPLSLILKGRRKISENFASKLSEKMNLSEQEQHYFKAPFRRKKAGGIKHDIRYEKSKDVYKINTVEHFYVLTSLRLAKLEPTFSALKTFLNISSIKLRQILDDLIEYDFITETKLEGGDSVFARPTEHLRIPYEQGSDLLKNLNRQTVDVLRSRVDDEDTVFQTLMIPGTRLTRERVNAIIDKCKAEIAASARDDENSDKVYVFGSYFFEV